MGERVSCSVEMVFHRDLGELLTGQSVLVHVVACDHSVETGEGRSCKTLPFSVGCSGEDIRRIADIGHLLDTCRDDDIRHAGRNCRYGLTEGKASGRTGRLDTGSRDVEISAESHVIGNERPDVFLTDESAG